MSDKIMEGLAARLAERDAVEDGEWRKETGPLREERDAEMLADAKERNAALRDAIRASNEARAAKDASELHAPPAPGPDASLRDEIRHALKWHSAPPEKRRAMAAAAAEMERARKLGETLGVEVKTAADIAALREVAGGAGKQSDLAARGADAEEDALAPYRAKAEAMGSTLPEALQRYTAAEDFLARDPQGALRWLCANYNVAPAELDPALIPYAQVANDVGMSLPGMVERYLAAEMLLDRDPATALRFLFRHYGIDPRSLA